ncbi:fibronectin [Bacillus thuringiensis]|uniref:Fibronectin n=1 Tax=Bacillus thuringiensis TaxID=1428 RepID=A0AAP4Q5P2_BACTU|nr:fibronectin [Bacillus thuringiensis]MDN7078216.1 fibronectin [Bacillus thuringiensis]MDQ7256900.1 fibronectin [Bacillus thuringiensis]MDR5030785.1 fibronectin [Bacillus thuringiensis]MDV6348988.1 fibronectin [Bacillus thuringiensis]
MYKYVITNIHLPPICWYYHTVTLIEEGVFCRKKIKSVNLFC